MSFTAEVKEELTRVPPVCSHCDKAVLAALVRTEGTLMFGGTGRYRVELATDVPSVARLIIKLLHQIYQLKTELTVRRSVLHKTPNYLIVLPMQPGLDGALHDAGVLSATGLEMGIDPHLVEKQCCTAAYLRGAFLGSGFISNPRGDFHFEMTLESEDLARGIVALGLVPVLGFTAVCYASPAAWVMADCFLFPAYFYCVKKRKAQYAPRAARAGTI